MAAAIIYIYILYIYHSMHILFCYPDKPYSHPQPCSLNPNPKKNKPSPTASQMPRGYNRLTKLANLGLAPKLVNLKVVWCFRVKGFRG